jgi:hypothetical protein
MGSDIHLSSGERVWVSTNVTDTMAVLNAAGSGFARFEVETEGHWKPVYVRLDHVAFVEPDEADVEASKAATPPPA